MKLFAILCVVVLCGFFILRDSTPKGLCPLNGDSIITLGDSLANGFGVSENDSFAIQIPRILGKNAIKLGIDGEVSAGLMARISSELDGKNPAVVIISIGGNDFLRKLDKSATQHNIEAIVRKAKAKTSCVVLLGVPDGILGGLVGGVSSVYYDIAKAEGVLLEKDAMPQILKQHSLKVDEIHPNKDGHTIIAQNIANLIRKAK